MVLNRIYNPIIKLMMQSESKVHDAYIVGYYGMENSGDDALMTASIIGAQKYLNAKSVLVSTSNPDLFNQFGVELNLLKTQQLFKGQNRLIHYQGAAKSKRIIFGGGSVFHSFADINMKRQMLKLSDARKSLAVGVGLGPFEDKAAEQECAKFLNECGFIGVRDAHSLKIAKDIAPKANVKLTFDLAAALLIASNAESSQPPLLVQSHSLNTVKRTNGVLINLCPVPVDAFGNVDQNQQDLQLDKTAKVIENIWKNTQMPISLLSMNGHSQHGDQQLAIQLQDRLGLKVQVTLLPYQPDPIEMLKIISEYRVFISSRLHGCVFGYLTQTPVIALNYHIKGQQWCEHIGQPHKYRFDALSFDPNTLIQGVLQGLENGFTTPALAVNDAIKQSLSNWSNHYE